MVPNESRRFVVLDRDGTILVERNYLSRPEQVELIPGAARAMRRLGELGLGLVVITNQSAIGRGLFDWGQLQLIHQRMKQILAAEGVRLAGIYTCPHLPEDDCSCRKPRPGLLAAAARELHFLPQESFVVGDKSCDIELGRGAGATTLLVRTGQGAEFAGAAARADHVVDDLAAAAAVIAQILARAAA